MPSLFPSRPLVELGSACYFPSFFIAPSCFDGCLSGASASRFFSLLSHFNLQSFEVHREGKKKRKFLGFTKILKITVKADGVVLQPTFMYCTVTFYFYKNQVFDHLGKGRGRRAGFKMLTGFFHSSTHHFFYCFVIVIFF